MQVQQAALMCAAYAWDLQKMQRGYKEPCTTDLQKMHQGK